MIEGLNHIGIAVQSLDEAIPIYRDKLGLSFEGIDVVESEEVRIAMFRAGSTRIELLEGTSETSPIRRFIEKRGPGVHHLAFTTDDAKGETLRLEGEGLRVLGDAARPGAHGMKVSFLHPKSMLGVLTELVEMPR